MEKEEDTGKLKAVNVMNKDGTPIVPPPRERRRRQHKDEKTTEEDGAKEEAAEAAKSIGDKENKEEKAKKGRNNRKNRGKDKAAKEGGGDAKPASAPKEAPFHASLEDDVKKNMEDKGLELGTRTTIDVAIGDTRIKLGQGGYAGCAMASGVVGEGTYTCDEKGTVTFQWERCLEYKDNAWQKGDPAASLVATISLSDGKWCLPPLDGEISFPCVSQGALFLTSYISISLFGQLRWSLSSLTKPRNPFGERIFRNLRKPLRRMDSSCVASYSLVPAALLPMATNKNKQQRLYGYLISMALIKRLLV